MTQRIMTMKKRAAIHQFVEIRLRETQEMTIKNAVAWTLYAERLQQDRLYAILERAGYCWLTKRRVWALRPKTKTE